MNPEFWHKCWERNSIGFHQPSVHQFLTEQVSNLLSREGSANAEKPNIFIPLCGKSLDMLWWAEHGNVVGSELSDIACQDFFSENQLTPEITSEGEHQLYQFANLAIYQGDFFQLTPTQFPRFDYIYDRAALIALPPVLRQQYVNHLASFIAEGTELVLINLEYPAGELEGPPFTISAELVHQLFSDFKVTEVTARDLQGDQFASRALPVSKLTERLFLIKR